MNVNREIDLELHYFSSPARGFFGKGEYFVYRLKRSAYCDNMETEYFLLYIFQIVVYHSVCTAPNLPLPLGEVPHKGRRGYWNPLSVTAYAVPALPEGEPRALQRQYV